MNINTIYNGDSLEVLRTFPDKSINLVITSPPYYGLRKYLPDNNTQEIGRELIPQGYIINLLNIFDECKRILTDDGSLWINIADSYGGTGNKGKYKDPKSPEDRNGQSVSLTSKMLKGSLLAIPERLVLGMLEHNWIRRNTIIWKKRNVIPGSWKNRFTGDFEYLYFFTKSMKYYFKQQFEPFSKNSDVAYRKKIRANKDYNVKEPYKKNTPYIHNRNRIVSQESPNRMWKDSESLEQQLKNGRNMRTVWDIPTKPTKGDHPAMFPEELVKVPIISCCPEGGIVLDPFSGNGTVAVVALKNNRNFVGIELNAKFVEDSYKRINLEINNV